MKLEFFGQIFEKYINVKVNDSASCGSRVFPCGQKDRLTDMTKLIGAFRNFSSSP